MITIDGKATAQHKLLFDKARIFASAIHGSIMRQQDAPIAYNCYYIASIGYTMAATKLLLNRYKSIQSPVVCATLNKMGINRNVARAIVFGPKSLGGLEMQHFYTLQGMKRLQYFMGHIACNDGNGNLMKICMEHTQLEVGSDATFFFLKHSHAGKALLNQSWLTEILSHLEICKGTITTGICWLCGRRKNITPRLTCRLLCLWEGGFGIQ
jgi:hypothetical protein